MREVVVNGEIFIEGTLGSFKKVPKPTEKQMSDNIYKMEHGSVVDTSLAAQVIQRFVADAKTDIVCEKIKLSLALTDEHNQKQILNRIKSLLKDGRIVNATLNDGFFFITGDLDDNPLFILAQVGSSENHRYREYDDSEDEDEGVIHLKFDIYGEPSASRQMRVTIEEIFGTEKLAHIKWWYEGAHGPSSQSVYLPKPKTVLCPEFYPDMGDPHKFIQDYLKSDASVLLLAGEPGTGKTTLLRHMITENNLIAHVIYDEALMRKDSIFQGFLFDKDSDMMVIEDADTILLPREDDGNKIMSRFLNVSDGLIKLPNKKLVFTTNISDFSKVDQALLRPGRCYGIVHTRPLNLSEAQAAARVADLPVPTERGEFTLAELFNQGYRPHARKVGFISGR